LVEGTRSDPQRTEALAPLKLTSSARPVRTSYSVPWAVVKPLPGAPLWWKLPFGSTTVSLPTASHATMSPRLTSSLPPSVWPLNGDALCA
jgi:hypothetical protein